MKWKIITTALILSLFLYGCSEIPRIPTADDSRATSEGISSIVDANNQFAFDLYSKVSGEGGNVFFSPWSISTALAMTYEGAKGKTAEEMRSVFHFPVDPNIRRPSFAKIQNKINEKDKEYKLHTANALWAQGIISF